MIEETEEQKRCLYTPQPVYASAQEAETRETTRHVVSVLEFLGNAVKTSALPFFHTTVEIRFWKSTENIAILQGFVHAGRGHGIVMEVFRGAPTPSWYPMMIFGPQNRTAMAVFMMTFRKGDRTLWCRKEKQTEL